MTKEEGWERAREQIRGATTLDLAIIEATNAVWKKLTLTKELDERSANIIIEVLTTHLPKAVEVRNSLDYLKRAFEIAKEERVTVYDALFVALAESLNEDLVTCDEKQYEVALKYVGARLLK
ncbi:MAG: type II toxin-antitoxin system VapC family toxin [Thermoprotei archaeon]